MWVLRKWHILRNRRIWQGLRQWDNKTGILTVDDLHENGKFEKMGNWVRIHQRSGKTSNEVTRRGILTKGKFRQIWRVCQKNHQGFGEIFKWDDKKGYVDSWRKDVIKGFTKIYKEMTKRGILTNSDYNKNGKLGNNWFKVCPNSNEMTNQAGRQLWVLRKWQIWKEFIKGLVKIKTSWRNRCVDNCEFNENDKCCKIREFSKDSS